MTYDIKALEAALKNLGIGDRPLSSWWLYSAVRHYERNCNWDIPEDGAVPDRQSGEHMATILNAVPTLLADAALGRRVRARDEALVEAVALAIWEIGASNEVTKDEAAMFARAALAAVKEASK